jgi:hypothetical protein
LLSTLLGSRAFSRQSASSSSFKDLVVTQFLTHVLIKLLKNPKIMKNNKKNPKNSFFNIFASFLAFSASSQKNLNFRRSLERVRLLTRYF